MKFFRYILIGLSIINTPLKANSINTTSNSSGSVVNQAVQVVPSRNFQYQMNTILCQGATLNISPFVSTTYGFSTPYEPNYLRPIYSNRDIEGDFDSDNNPVGDGDVDAGYRGEILYFEKVRTGMKQSNTSINGGITATFSIPLDRIALRECRESMKKQNELYEASLAAKRLNYEMSRAKTCHQNLLDGFRFKEGTAMAAICSDIEVVTPINVEHTHKIKN
nr:gp165 [uncultured Mediterranean phage uvMED]BAR26568.1 gp165 [uncultured Mediterranean phage uvMED]BAR26691.1 gp165 [uncultured Mediterranean phage uvMED]